MFDPNIITPLQVLNNVQEYAKSVEEMDKNQKEIKMSAGAMISNLQELRKELQCLDDLHHDSILGGEANDHLKKLEEGVRKVQDQLGHANNPDAQETSQGKFSRALYRLKNRTPISTLLKELKSLETTTLMLCSMISA